MPLLEIKGLTISLGGKRIIEDLTMDIEEGDSQIIFGPNGAGKSTLLYAIAGIIKPERGRIIFAGKDMTRLSIDKRANMGIATAFQSPPEIKGVKLRELLKICIGKKEEEDFSHEEKRLINEFNLEEYLGRDINLNFSGGERKRAEILELILRKPRLLLIDEPDSGVDVESLRLIGKRISAYLEKSGASAILITHHGTIFRYIPNAKGCVLINRDIHCRDDPKKIYKDIIDMGYNRCVNCRRQSRKR